MLINNAILQIKLPAALKRKAASRARRKKLDLSKHIRTLLEADLDAEQAEEAATLIRPQR